MTGTRVQARAAGGGYAGGRRRVDGYGYGYNGFFPKKTDRPFSNPYPFTRLYPGTGTRVWVVPGGF
jgi:hypothetical protein